jgi:hypothetical protein
MNFIFFYLYIFKIFLFFCTNNVTLQWRFQIFQIYGKLIRKPRDFMTKPYRAFYRTIIIMPCCKILNISSQFNILKNQIKLADHRLIPEIQRIKFQPNQNTFFFFRRNCSEIYSNNTNHYHLKKSPVIGRLRNILEKAAVWNLQSQTSGEEVQAGDIHCLSTRAALQTAVRKFRCKLLSTPAAP